MPSSKKKPAVKRPAKKYIVGEKGPERLMLSKETELEEVIRRLGWTEEVASLQARFVRGVLNQR